MNIGLALKVGRAAMGYNAHELAAKAGVSRITIIRIENGEGTTNKTIKKIFDAMDKVSFMETYDGLMVNIRLYPTDEQYLAALGPCGK